MCPISVIVLITLPKVWASYQCGVHIVWVCKQRNVGRS